MCRLLRILDSGFRRNDGFVIDGFMAGMTVAYAVIALVKA